MAISTLAAFGMVASLSPVIATSSSARMSAAYVQANSSVEPIFLLRCVKSLDVQN